jgi:hypothetical protein
MGAPSSPAWSAEPLGESDWIENSDLFAIDIDKAGRLEITH